MGSTKRIKAGQYLYTAENGRSYILEEVCRSEGLGKAQWNIYQILKSGRSYRSEDASDTLADAKILAELMSQND